MKKLILLIACLTGIGYAFAQSVKPEVIAPAGDYFTNTKNSMSWTLGECITETYSTKDNTLTQGFQQSTYTITAINQLAYDGISVKAFPNPTTDFINVLVETTGSSQINCSVELFDIQGKLLMNQRLEDKSMQLDMSQFANGTYFLKVSDRGKTMLQNFKILKN
jgi:hypothetical protein